MRTFRSAATFHPCPPGRRVLAATLGALVTLLTSAPLSAQSTGAQRTPTPVPAAKVKHNDTHHAIGDATHLLLELQASGRLSVPAQPILGDEAAASYKRYIDSFSHPIPAYFQTMVGQRSASGGGSSSGL